MTFCVEIRLEFEQFDMQISVEGGHRYIGNSTETVPVPIVRRRFMPDPTRHMRHHKRVSYRRRRNLKDGLQMCHSDMSI